jgi:hypothetical protein
VQVAYAPQVVAKLRLADLHHQKLKIAEVEHLPKNNRMKAL